MTCQNGDKLGQNGDKLGQNGDKLGQNGDKLGQNGDNAKVKTATTISRNSDNH